MTDTTFPPGGELRKRRPPVIEHEPLPIVEGSGEDGPDYVPWEFDRLGVIVIPGLLTWEKFETLWSTVDGIRQGSMFMVGDALNAGEQKFGEQVWQIDTSGYRPETLRNAQWVSRAIPVSRRRRLPWSYHQAVATSQLTAQEQDELLDLAEEMKRRHEPMTTKTMQAWVADKIAAKKPNSQPEREPVRPSNGPEGDVETVVDTQAEPGAAEAAQQDSEPEAPEVEPDDEAPQAAPQQPHVVDPDEVRACMEEIRAVANAVALGQYDALALRALSNRVLASVGMTATGWSSNVLLSAEAAERMIPDHWALKVYAGRRVFGGRQWEMRAERMDTGFDGLVLVNGPVQAICYADLALGAILSDRRR